MPDGGSELEIVPEPSAEERAAVEAALRALGSRRGGDSSSWWEAGVREGVGDADQGGPLSADPP